MESNCERQTGEREQGKRVERRRRKDGKRDGKRAEKEAVVGFKQTGESDAAPRGFHSPTLDYMLGSTHYLANFQIKADLVFIRLPQGVYPLIYIILHGYYNQGAAEKQAQYVTF